MQWAGDFTEKPIHEGGMMEAGYTKFPNELMDWLLAKSSVLSKREIVVFLAIVRNTIGWRRDSSVMSCRFIAGATGLDPANVSKAIKLLEELGAIIVDRSAGTTTVKLDWEQTLRCCQIDNSSPTIPFTGTEKSGGHSERRTGRCR